MKNLERNLLKEGISKRLQANGFGVRHANYEAGLVIDDMPDVLLVNVMEWLNNEPISDIMYGDMSIKKIMEINQLNEKAFVPCAQVMMMYIKNGCEDSWICTHYFRA